MSRLRSVLVIDDNPADLRFTELHLLRSGLVDRVLLQPDGERALEWFQSPRAPDEFLPDVILLDINMPSMDGFEFLERYQQLKDAGFFEDGSPPVLIVTSSAAHVDLDRASQFEPVRDYLLKPLTPNSVRGLVTRFGQRLH